MPGDSVGDPPGPTRHDAGGDSISVSELLSRHAQLDAGSPQDPGADRRGETMPHRPVPATAEPQSPVDSGQLFITELLRREGRLDEPPPPPPRPDRSYRQLIAVAALVLVGGIATAGIAALAGSQDDRPHAGDAAPVAMLSGPEALLPHAIAAVVDVPAGDAALGQVDSTGPGTRVTADLPEPGVATDPVTEIVTSFFRAAPTSPTVAYELLVADLRGDGVEAFSSSWEAVDQVRIESVRRNGSVVRAVLTLVRNDGATLQLVQDVRVRMEHITEATLLSAALSR